MTMIEVNSLTNRYRRPLAVDGLSVRVRPGVATGFVGPHGAGTSTTLRMVLGLDRPTTVAGRPTTPPVPALRQVGRPLDTSTVRRESRREHHRAFTRADSIARARVGEVREQVGLASVTKGPSVNYMVVVPLWLVGRWTGCGR